MNLPINGRIAIIDDEISQAQPLLEVLSKHQCPTLYFSGDPEYLPDSEDNYNDVRIVFLDINLFGPGEVGRTILASKLVGVLRRVISKDNFPYIVVYWSKHSETDPDIVERDVFKGGLKDRQPIGFLSAKKSGYFTLEGEKKEDFDEKVGALFGSISEKLNSEPAFNALIEWENIIHKSADATLQTTFQPTHIYPNWANEANNLLTSFGKGVAGKHYHTMSDKDKMINNFTGINHILSDEIEEKTSTIREDQVELLVDYKTIVGESKIVLNSKLLFSDICQFRSYPGSLMVDTDPNQKGVYNTILNGAIRNKIQEELQNEHDDITDESIANAEQHEQKVLKNKLKALIRERRRPFDEAVERVVLVITPLCDYVQKKAKNCKVIRGVILPSECLKYLSSSDAIYCSPKFAYAQRSSVIIIDLKYFFTKTGSFSEDTYVPIMRVRNLMLADIQSKLARHITRTGLLYLE